MDELSSRSWRRTTGEGKGLRQRRLPGRVLGGREGRRQGGRGGGGGTWGAGAAWGTGTFLSCFIPRPPRPPACCWA